MLLQTHVSRVARVFLAAILSVACGFAAAVTQDDIERLAKQANAGSAAAGTELERIASGGDPLAQNAMGLLFLSGEAVPRDEALAIEWFSKAAKQGNVESAHNLAVVYERSRGPARNPRGQYLLARMMLQGRGVERDEAGGWRLMDLAAAAGDIDAQYQLALAFGNGIGRARDDARAIDWLRRSANGGQAEAQYLLSGMYAGGSHGLPKDDGEAMRWLRRSAQQGYPQAQYALGVAYLEGHGIAKDSQQGARWITLAAQQGHKGAEALLNRARQPKADR